MIQKSSQLDCV
jgi:hypothetical protein